MLLDSDLTEHFTIIHIDTSDHRDAENYNKIDLTNIFLGIKNVISLIISLIKYKPKIVYCSPAPFTFPFLREATFIVIVKAFSKAKIVLHIHSDKYFINTFYKKSNSLMKKLIKVIFYLCDCTIVLGKSLVSTFNIFCSNVHYLWNGIDYTPFKKPKISPKKNRQKIKLGYLCNLSEEKGIITLIKSIALLDKKYLESISIDIVGDWMPDEQSTKHNVEQIIKDSNLNNYITMRMGIYDDKLKQQFYWGLDVFIFPSNREAFPLVILEAMSQSCAIISSDVGVISEIVIQNKTGILINPNDPLGLSQEISYLIKNPRVINKYAEAGKRRVINNFLLKDNIEGLRIVFDNLLIN